MKLLVIKSRILCFAYFVLGQPDFETIRTNSKQKKTLTLGTFMYWKIDTFHQK